MRWPIDRNPMTGAAASAPVEAIWLRCDLRGGDREVGGSCRVFAPDLPGFGERDPMPEGWGFAECSMFLCPLLTALGLRRVSLIGLSMGGGIALGFALKAAERVERLVLIDSACLSDTIPGGWRRG